MTDNGQNQSKDRLSQLLAFFQTEVEGEKHMEMVLTGFGLPAEPDKNQKGKVTNLVVNSSPNTPSASVLFAA